MDSIRRWKRNDEPELKLTQEEIDAAEQSADEQEAAYVHDVLENEG